MTKEEIVKALRVCGEEHEWDEYRAAYCDVCGAKMEVDNG